MATEEPFGGRSNEGSWAKANELKTKITVNDNTCLFIRDWMRAAALIYGNRRHAVNATSLLAPGFDSWAGEAWR